MARPKKRKRLAAPESLDGVLHRAGENRFARDRPPLPIPVWNQAVGLRIAERARPVGLERGILTIRVATSVWANELSLLSSTILERLQAQGIDVKELRFRVGPLEPPAAPLETRRTKKVPPPARLPEDLVRGIDRIADDELKQIVTDAARANLAWQANRK